MVTQQQTYAPPPLPNGATWSPNAVPVRFNPTSRVWEMFANGQWLPRQGLTFEQVNAMGRAGQAFQIDYAASGGQANTAAVQREIAPRVFAADSAQLSPEGSILAPGTPPAPRQAVATQQTPNPRAFAPDGATLSPEGSILSLPRSGEAETPAPAAPATTNVDPGANWDYSGAPPRTAPPQQRPTQPGETPFLPPPPTPDYADYDRSIGVNNPAASPAPPDQNQSPTREQMWLEWLMGSSPSAGRSSVPAFATGGAQPAAPRAFAPPMPNDALPLPDAIVGEGLETATPQFDTPERSELTLEPMPNFGPDIFKVKVAEGPTGVQADGGLLVLPLSEPAAVIAREHLRPADGIAGEMQGDTFESGPLSLPTAPGPGAASGETPALAAGGLMDDEGFGGGPLLTVPLGGAGGGTLPTPAGPPAPPPGTPSPLRGLYPPPSLLGPSEEWQGLPGGAPPPMGNIRDWAIANEAEKQRYDQFLKANGILSGIQGIEQDLRRSAPSRLNLPSYVG